MSADWEPKYSMSKLADRGILDSRILPAIRRVVGGRISQEVVSETVQILDFLAIVLSGAAASIYLLAVIGDPSLYDGYGLTVIVAAIAFVFALRRLGAYSFRRLSQFGWQLGRVTMAWCATFAALSTVAFLAKVAVDFSRGWAVTWGILVIANLALLRLALRALILRWAQQGRLSRTVAIVGAGEAGEQLVAKLRTDEGEHIEIAGVFDDRLNRVSPYVAGCRVLGTTDDLVALTRCAPMDEIIIALPLRAEGRIADIVAKLSPLPVDLRVSIDQIGSFPMRGIGETGSARTIEIIDRPLKDWSGIVKWLEDQVISVVCLILFAPLMGLIALAIRLESPGAAFFKQKRYGFNNELVEVLKFRTMYTHLCDDKGENLTERNDRRITRIGRLLRKSSLDELPQLVNVIKGEMSLVGPRPHPVSAKAAGRFYREVVAKYSFRHKVKPGITGWAQVNGWRGETDTEEQILRRIEHDLFYIDNWSFTLDLKILFMTIFTLFRHAAGKAF
jgi:Undecaprenyl-phosphate glucose phosphotransferase